MYETIDSTPYGDVHWESFVIHYNVDKDTSSNEAPPTWKTAEYEGWFHDPQKLIHNIITTAVSTRNLTMLLIRSLILMASTIFETYSLVIGAGEKWYIVLLSLKLKISNFVYLQDKIAKDWNTHGAMIVPIIYGSDKTTVSVATGNNEYWPVYISIGNIHNNVWRAHQDGLVLLRFLPIPKSKISWQEISISWFTCYT